MQFKGKITIEFKQFFGPCERGVIEIVVTSHLICISIRDDMIPARCSGLFGSENVSDA